MYCLKGKVGNLGHSMANEMYQGLLVWPRNLMDLVIRFVDKIQGRMLRVKASFVQIVKEQQKVDLVHFSRVHVKISK